MVENDQLTLDMFVPFSNVLPREVVGEGVFVVEATPSFRDALSPTTHIYKDGKLVGYLSNTHLKIISCVDSLKRRGESKFTLLDVVVELEATTGLVFMETSIAARIRELCQWGLILRVGDRRGVYFIP